MDPEVFIWLIYALWLILIVYLAVSAKAVKLEPQGHLLQSFSLLLAIVLSVLLQLLPILGFVNFARVTLVLSSIGVTLCALGMAVLVWARQHLGRNWSQTVTVKEGHELVTSGPYHLIRHPMYAGGLFACIGSAIVFGRASVFLFLTLPPPFPSHSAPH